jgi:hypothetical protein
VELTFKVCVYSGEVKAGGPVFTGFTTRVNGALSLYTPEESLSVRTTE